MVYPVLCQENQQHPLVLYEHNIQGVLKYRTHLNILKTNEDLLMKVGNFLGNLDGDLAIFPRVSFQEQIQVNFCSMNKIMYF